MNEPVELFFVVVVKHGDIVFVQKSPYLDQEEALAVRDNITHGRLRPVTSCTDRVAKVTLPLELVGERL